MNDPETGPMNGAHRTRILIVEDNRAAGRGLSRLLQFEGYEVTEAIDGATALAALREAPAPDIVLTDLQLPDLDGRDVARQARSLIPTPHVALITGWDLNATPADFDRWGIDWIFLKPLDIQDLIVNLRLRASRRRDTTQVV